MHEEVKCFSEETLLSKTKTAANLEAFYKSCQVVGATCLGADHPLFKWKEFDICIIDEASQILEPICFAPIFKTKRFVLVGDHLQLPPLVRSDEGKKAGLDKSLLERMCEEFPNEQTVLNVQYRMCKEYEQEAKQSTHPHKKTRA